MNWRSALRMNSYGEVVVITSILIKRASACGSARRSKPESFFDGKSGQRIRTAISRLSDIFYFPVGCGSIFYAIIGELQVRKCVMTLVKSGKII